MHQLDKLFHRKLPLMSMVGTRNFQINNCLQTKKHGRL